MRASIVAWAAATLVATLATASPALAAWKLSSAPDATFGGTRTILAGEASKGLEIHALCNGDNRAFNLILPEWEKDLGGGRAMTLEIRNDAGAEVVGTGTTFRSDAADFTGIALDDTDRLEDILRLIALAEASISIRSTNVDWGVSTTYYADVRQLAAEARAFAEACGFAAIPVAPPGSPSRPAWTVAAGLGSSVTRMRGSLAEGIDLAFSCEADGSASLELSRSAGAGGAAMSQPVNATLVVDDGRLNTSPVSVDIGADGTATLYFSDSSLVPELLIDLASARGRIVLEFTYPATDTFEEWEAPGYVAAEAAAFMVSACNLAPRPPVYVPPDPRLAPATPGTWRMEEQALSDGSLTQTLSARTATGAGRLIFMCDEQNEINLTYVTDDLSNMPIREKGETVSLHAEMQGLGYPLNLRLMVVEGDGGIFMSPSSPSVDSVLAALREGPPEMKLSFIDLTTDSDIYEQSVATDNVVAEADRFVSICYAE